MGHRALDSLGEGYSYRRGEIFRPGEEGAALGARGFVCWRRECRVMAQAALKVVKVPPNSASLEEARKRTIDFFKTACRSLPTVMEIYNLDDLVTTSQIRSTISAEIRKNAHITNHKVIDLLLLKATEELSNIVCHYKQQHHLIGQYVVGRGGLIQETEEKDKGISDFLKQFYTTNYF